MEALENAGQEVLLSYRHFLDSVGSHLFNFNEKLFPPTDISSIPAVVKICKTDNIPIWHIVETDNKVQRKLLIVFAALCKEVDLLKQELNNSYLLNILYYSEGMLYGEISDTNVSASKLFPLLINVWKFTKRCRILVKHFLKQLICFSTLQSKPGSSKSDHTKKLQNVLTALGDLLLILVKVDVALKYNNNIIETHLYSLQQHISNTINTKASKNNAKHKPLLNILKDMHNGLLSQQILENILTDGLRDEYLFGHSLGKEITTHLKNTFMQIEASKNFDIHGANELLSNSIVLFVYSSNIFGTTDKKLNKIIIETCKKYLVIPLFGEVLWSPAEFISRYCEKKDREIYIKTEQQLSAIQKYLENCESSLLKEVKALTFQIYKWSLMLENTVTIHSVHVKLTDIDIVNLYLEGLQTSFHIRQYLNYVSYLHCTCGKPMTKTVVVLLCKLVELLEAVHSIFKRHHVEINQRLNHYVPKLSGQILNCIIKSKSTLLKERRCNDQQVDLYSTLQFVEKMFYGACTENRMLLAQLALSLSNSLSLLDDSTQLTQLINKISLIAMLQDKIEDSLACNLLFTCNVEIIPKYLHHVISSRFGLARMQLFVRHQQLDRFEVSPQLLKQTFSNTKTLLLNHVLKPAWNDIETQLRLHVHSHLQINNSLIANNRNFKKSLSIPPMFFFDSIFSFKGIIEKYLDNSFYDLTTVALHDWKTYKEMRSLGEFKYGLKSIEDNLPSQTLAQGLDVLEIMRNIHIFVSKYLYNMNNQCFLESKSGNKHLNTIKINQIASSIWTHGTGIMNTTTNFVYQYLKKKMMVFSQFLFDDNVNARLTKDMAYFQEHKMQHGFTYPFERGEKFNKGIIRLGSTSGGESYFDQYRVLISLIGNALGYIRLVRAGGLHHCLSSSSYFPSFEELDLIPSQSSETLNNSISGLLRVTEGMKNNFSDGAEYFKLLVDVFSLVLNTPGNEHLQLFVMIIPPLTINYINYLVGAKEKMNKRSKDGSVFTDDGFSLGVTYLLQVLNLQQEFDSLHWFDSVKVHYECEEKNIRSQACNPLKGIPIHENTLKLTLKRLDMYKQEFQLLQYNISSSRAFFCCDVKCNEKSQSMEC